nr:MAG TPA: hypothetical protein [Caudoviricetes sp.]
MFVKLILSITSSKFSRRASSVISAKAYAKTCLLRVVP